MTADTAPAKCAKPGCGAQRLIGKPCTDGDCPQQWVHHTSVAALVEAARRDEREACALVVDCTPTTDQRAAREVMRRIRARSTEEQA